MTAVEHHDRSGWLDRRRGGIGGSDAAAVVGLHPWVSPLALYFDKTGEVVNDSEPTEHMEWGLRLEPIVAEKWCEVNGRQMRKFRSYDPDALRVHPDYPWMIANLDGEVVDGAAIYEGKTASGWAADDWNEGVPPYVVVQVQHQLAVTGYDVGYVACLIGGCRYVQEEIGRDDEFIAALIEAEARFWERVQRRIPPPADSHPSTSEALKARWQETLDQAVELGSEGVDLVGLRHRAKAEKDAAGADQERAENRLRQLLGESEVGTVFGEIAVTWRPDKNGKRTLRVREII